ncbi:VanZ family protein [Acetobacteroides hydrogenigenes]|uniref:VanZ like protein n=1 Tax=Acetobacteroides hydrogenigenes TaxID=979970 RepID=A0A4V6NM29_9BACT|nr:VanZ family protein [Acetobacteroides hydrogenigenes]TCN72110.1 VanZ like protein [Acetobacteroides hydrogenigenes]
MVKKSYWLLVTVWAAIILVLCGMPPQDVDKVKFFDLPYMDKIVHFALYFVLAMLVMAVLTLNSHLKTSRWTYIITITICLLYGWLIEVLQRAFFAGRSFEWLDVVADTAGAVVGVLLYKKVSRWVKGRFKTL